MKRLGVFTIAALVVAGMAAAEPNRPMSLPGSSLSITAPAGWTGQVDGSGGALVLATARSRMSLLATQPLLGEDLDGLARRCRDDLARLLPDFQEVSSDAVLIGGQSWRVLSYRFAIAQRIIEQRQFVGLIGQDIVVATLDGDPVARGVIESLLAALGSSRPRLSP